MESKIKHLEFIQNLIERMSANSFLLKRWTVALVTGILAFNKKEMYSNSLYIVFLPILCFWMLDAYFLFKERQYRNLYNKVRRTNESQIDFDLSTNESSSSKYDLLSSMFSTLHILFYSTLILAILLTIITNK